MVEANDIDQVFAVFERHLAHFGQIWAGFDQRSAFYQSRTDVDKRMVGFGHIWAAFGLRAELCQTDFGRAAFNQTWAEFYQMLPAFGRDRPIST